MFYRMLCTTRPVATKENEFLVKGYNLMYRIVPEFAFIFMIVAVLGWWSNSPQIVMNSPVQSSVSASFVSDSLT